MRLKQSLGLALAIVMLAGITTNLYAAKPKAAAAKVPDKTWEAVYEEGLDALKKKDYPKADKQLMEAMKLAAKFNPNDRRVAQNLTTLGNFYLQVGQLANAENFLRQALAVYRGTLGENSLEAAAVMNNLGSVYTQAGRFPEADALLTQSLNAFETNLKTNLERISDNLVNLGRLQIRRTKYEDAEASFKRALNIRTQVYGEGHPRVATVIYSIAEMYRAQDQSEKAETQYKRAIETVEKHYGKEHPDEIPMLRGYSELLKKNKRTAEAEKLDARIATLIKVAGAGLANEDKTGSRTETPKIDPVAVPEGSVPQTPMPASP